MLHLGFFSRRAVVSYWRKYVHEILVNRLGGLSLPRKSVVRLTDRPDMTLDVYRGRKITIQQHLGFITLQVKSVVLRQKLHLWFTDIYSFTRQILIGATILGHLITISFSFGTIVKLMALGVPILKRSRVV